MWAPAHPAVAHRPCCRQTRNTQHSTQRLPALGASNSTCKGAALILIISGILAALTAASTGVELLPASKGLGPQFLQGGTHRNEAATMSLKNTAVGLTCYLLPRLPGPPGHRAEAPARHNIALSLSIRLPCRHCWLS